jgi:tRNA threonylcarbamoyladenosine biosynthesis protein TsaE
MSAPEPVETTTAADTEARGAALARTLRPGDVVLITGEMGAGKTTFVRGALRALGVTGAVTSPTFTLGRRYDDATPPASHLDLHRLASMAGEDPALLDDYVDDDRVAFIEWPEVAEAEPALAARVAARVLLEHAGHDRRRLTVSRP